MKNISKPLRGSETRYKHQEQAIQFIYPKKKAALFMEMGTGKTKVAIDWIVNKYKTIPNVLVIAPKSVIPVWEEEVKKHTEKNAVISLLGSKQERINLINTYYSYGFTYFPIFFILNYDGLSVIQHRISELKWGAVILDESTRIKNHTANRTRLCVKLFRDVKRKLILSGTPITKHYFDIFTQFLFLDDGKTFDTSFYAFRNKYFRPAFTTPQGQIFEWIPKYGMKKEIRRLIAKKSFRIKKEDCLDLPPKVYETRYVDMTKLQEQYYNEMKRMFEVRLKSGVEISTQWVIVQIMKLSQITSGFLKKDKKIYSFKSNKLIELENLLEELTPKNKVIVWARFRKDIEEIKKLCDNVNIKSEVLYGKTEARDKAIKNFQTKKEIRCFISQPASGGYGINLSCASYSIFYSNDYSFENRLQAEDRCHRIGSEKFNHVTYVDILTKNTIDEIIKRSLERKQDLVRKIIDHPDLLVK